ncbi:MAG TPA: ChaN family lipoprotein [Nitrospiraceae bacterium]|nr:ChaN family lipoprotein [Nitrospiraceae bacterium]
MYKTPMMFATRAIFVKFNVLLIVGVLWFTVACTSGGGDRSSAASQDRQHPPFKKWQVIDTATGQLVSLDQWMALLLQQEIIYLGEEHHNRFHIDAALRVLQRLKMEGRTPALAMEMFGWDGQAALDQYVSGIEMNRQEFLEAVRWRQNWGGPFEDYEPLVQLAKEHHWPLDAMNPPKPLVRIVAKNGLAQAESDPMMAQWGMKDEAIIDDPFYRARILQQLQACHGKRDDNLYQTMLEASMLRDEGMAKTLVHRLNQIRSGSDTMAGPLVSYTGGGHIQYNLPVPKRVARRLADQVRQVSVYMTSFEVGRIEEFQDMIREKIADYLWLTPVSAQGPPRRC